jgi:hypothetical protein
MKIQSKVEQVKVNFQKEVFRQRLEDLTCEKAALEAYLLAKFRAKDYHAVQDAASDLREVECALDTMRQMKGLLEEKA